MKEIGVKAVVKNVNGFVSNIKKMTKSSGEFSDSILEIGSMLSEMGTEKFSNGILDIAGAFADLHPAAKAAFVVFKELGREIGVLANDIKNIFVGAIKLALTVLVTLKNTITKVISFALKPFQKAWDAITGAIKRVAEIATGILIANTIRKLGQVIAEAGKSAVDAAINFQTLEVRLKGLAARQIYKEGNVENFGEALGLAGERAEELLEWVIDLSLKAPVSTEAIANTLTMATSYGLGAEAAKKMTKAVLVFASGMGLTDLAQRKIIENFGQMIQQGKITTMEMRDMARAAFVPFADLLNKTAELLGMTADEFDGTVGSINKFAKENGLDPVMTMMDAFVELTDTEFIGAIERMGATIKGLQVRFQNLVGVIIGLNVLKPSLDLMGGSISKIFDAIAESEGIKSVSKEIGTTLSEIVEGLLGELPSVDMIVKGIEDGLGRVNEALKLFREGDTMGGLQMLGVPQSLLDFIDKVKAFTTEGAFATFLTNVSGGFKNLLEFWTTNKGTIIEALLIALGEIAEALGIEVPENPGEGFLAWTENLEVEDVLLKIDSVKTSILEFIDAIKLIPVAWEENKGTLALMGLAFAALGLVIKAPFLSLLAFIPMAIGAGLTAGLVTFWKSIPDYLEAGKDVMGAFLEGMGIWWNEKAVPWILKVIQWASDMLAKVGINSGFIDIGNGGTDTVTRPDTQVPARPDRSNNITNNYNFDMAVDQTKQSPSRMRDDVAVLLSGVRH